MKLTQSIDPQPDPAADDKSIDIASYIPHPGKPDTYIGRVETLPRKRFRGLLFEKPVTKAALLKGRPQAVSGRPIVRETRRSASWAIEHRFKAENGLLTA